MKLVLPVLFFCDLVTKIGAALADNYQAIQIEKLINNSHGDITPFSPEHLTIVEYLAQIGPPRDIRDTCMYFNCMMELVKAGNTILLQNFVDSGYNLPPCRAIDFTKNVLETLQFFRARKITDEEYGARAADLRKQLFDEQKFAYTVEELVRLGSLSGSEFETLLNDGVSLSRLCENDRNWFHHAMVCCEFDIALIAFDRGLRLSLSVYETRNGRLDYTDFNFEQRFQKFADMKGARDRIRLIAEASNQEESVFSSLPKELQLQIACAVHSLDFTEDFDIRSEIFEKQ